MHHRAFSLMAHFLSNRCRGPSVVGLLGATAWSLAQQQLVSLPLVGVMLVTLLLASMTKISPIWLLLGSAIAGWAMGR